MPNSFPNLPVFNHQTPFKNVNEINEKLEQENKELKAFLLKIRETLGKPFQEI